MTDKDLRWQDEILQLLYWMRGEKLGTDVTAEQLNRFLGLESFQLEKTLQQLATLGLVWLIDRAGENCFKLTPRGVEEGQRRFHDEFSSYLGKESHLECGDPNCDCHSPDWDGVCHLSESR
jgi:hypothetical protein